MLSNDFNTIETKSPLFFVSLGIPLILSGIIAILVTRFGWPGIIIFGVALVIIPVQVLIGKITGSIMQKINIYKDRRVKICTEIIEGIKFIKFYGWELAFKNIIQGLRNQEIRNYFKLSFGRSLERSIGNTTANFAGFCCFTVMDLTGSGSGLSTAKIFSTMDLMATLRTVVFYLGITLGFYFELRIIFSRFCTIFNIENKKMIRIDEATKKPMGNQAKAGRPTGEGGE
jgi:ABC-type bacteriocin/lantibiotic exporter with double-glycine peptidase domain